MINVLFMGTPDFAETSLKELYDNREKLGINIVGVVTNIDRPAGRGHKLVSPPVKQFAIEKDLKVFQPIKIRNNEEFIDEIKKLDIDIVIVVAYGKILPKEFLDIPKYGAINVHGSLLPKYRGAAPIQWAVLNGDKETGITTMFMDEGMDTGDMILKEKVEIGDDETTGELWDKMAVVGGNLLVKTIDTVIKAIDKTGYENKNDLSLEEKEQLREELKKEIGAEKQGDDFTVAPMLEKEMAKIDWNKSAGEIKNLVRGLNPIMGCYTFLDGKKIKIWKVDKYSKEDFKKLYSEIDLENIEAGKVLVSSSKVGLYVYTGDGIISVIEIQGENARRMTIKEFLLGNKIEEGKILE